MSGRGGVAAAAAVAVALAGCGGGGGGSSHGTGATVHDAQTGAAYRWLVPTAGPPPSVAAENRAPGAGAWRLSGPSRAVGGNAHGRVQGYVAEQSLRPGDTQRIYVDAAGGRSVTIRVFRMGWYGGKGGHLVLQSQGLPAVRQPPCTHRAQTGLTECRWRATLAFPIPSALPSGVYVAKLATSTGAQRDVLFVVEAAHPLPMLAQLSTATYEAYNAWGGDSLYPGGTKHVGVTGTTQGVEVSYDRPYDSATGAGQFFARDVAMVRFLERNGYPVSYTTNESVERDPGQLEGHRLLLDFGHSEYWSAAAAGGFARARDAGTNLVFLSSDTLAWRVRFQGATPASSESGRAAHRIVGYKEHVRLDPVRTPASGAFPDLGAALTGSAYEGCITPRIRQPGPPTYRYFDWAPAPGLTPAWLFAGTGVTAATRIRGIVGYEVDQRTPASPPGTTTIGGGAATCMPAPDLKGRLAQTTLYRARSGAFVFASGTLGWELGLYPVRDASPDAPHAPDPRLVAMTRNLFAHLLAQANSGG